MCACVCVCYQSYMLSALVVLLLRDFFNGRSALRVVYIPDCRQLLTDPLKPMQQSLLLAFADDEEQCQLIYQAETREELIDVVSQHAVGTLLFVVDQFNALTVHGGSQDPRLQAKNDAESLIGRCAMKQFIVRALSINDENKTEVDQKQMNQLTLPLFGELSKVSTQLCTHFRYGTLTGRTFSHPLRSSLPVCSVRVGGLVWLAEGEAAEGRHCGHGLGCAPRFDGLGVGQ